MTDLGKVLSDGLHVVRRRSLIFVVSDFISTPNWEKPLSLLSARHDVIAVKLTDPLEPFFPILGLSPSRMRNRANSFSSTPTIKAFGRALPLTRKQSKRLRSAFEKAGVDVVELSTDDDVLDAMISFAAMRKQSLRRSA